MKNKKQLLKKTAVILLGNAIYALAAAYFILPVGLITGGTTGIGIFINHYTGFEISLFVSIFNLVMFVLGALVLGKNFALTTLVSTFCYPVFLRAAQYMVSVTGELTADPMLCTIFAGVMIGVGIGMVIQEGASTGGMDIPPLIVQKKTGISVSVMMYVFDFLILLLQMTFSNREQVLYGILMICIYTFTLEEFLLFGKSRVQIKIISEKYQEINDAILNRLDRGTTLFEIEGGYKRIEKYAILTVVNRRELFHVNELAKAIDPDAFIIIGQVKEVRGRGFTVGKKYE
jgi:uncharacterized membrane-anchored protein YitT (DUF2179 family)